MPPNHATIGILAGMGPRSTAPFLEAVLDRCQTRYGATQDIDYPHILIYSLPTPFSIAAPLDHRAMLAAIAGGLARLQAAEVAFIAMPCNTAHAYYDQLAADISVPLLNMVAETAAALTGITSTCALLATRATIASGIYQRGLGDLAIDLLHTEAIQDAVDAILTGIRNRRQQAARATWSQLATQLRDQGCMTAVIACTDLTPIIAPNLDRSLVAIGTNPGDDSDNDDSDNDDNPDLHIIDATACLATAVVERYLAIGGRRPV